jgi:hypothetical protein
VAGASWGTRRAAAVAALWAAVVVQWLCAVAGAATPGTIATLVGDPTAAGFARDIGQSPAAVVAGPGDTFYLIDQHTNAVRKVSVDGQETTVAGNGQYGYRGDGGPALGAEFRAPTSLGIDAGGDVVIADAGSQRVRLVAAASCSVACPFGLGSMAQGNVYTIAGNGTQGYAGGQPATHAELDEPAGVAVDSAGDVLISDGGNGVKLVAAQSCAVGCPFGLASMLAGDIYTIAGGGFPTTLGDGGLATAAKLGPVGLAVDGDGNLLIADNLDSRVRLVAGADCSGSCAYGLPSMQAGDIYTIAGTGDGYPSGDHGPATSAGFRVSEVTVDSVGDVLIDDGFDYAVRLVAAGNCAGGCPFGLPSTVAGEIYTVAGGGVGPVPDGAAATGGVLDAPEGIAVDGGGNLLIAQAGYDDPRLRLVAAAGCAVDCAYGLAATAAGDIYTVAGDGGYGTAGNGVPTADFEFAGLGRIVQDAAGDLIVRSGVGVRLIAAANCTTSCPFGLPATFRGDIYSIAGGGTSVADGVPATTEQVGEVGALTLDGAGDVVFVQDISGNIAVRILAASDCTDDCPYGRGSMIEGDIYTLTRYGTTRPPYGNQAGLPASAADPGYVSDLAVDRFGNLLVAGGASTEVLVIANASCSSGCPYGLSSMAVGDIETIAGSYYWGETDLGDGGPAGQAHLENPEAVSVDPAGDLLVADGGTDGLSGTVRLIAASDCAANCPFGLDATTRGDIYTIAGTGPGGDGNAPGDNGPAAEAAFEPGAMTIDDAGDLLFADRNGPRVRLIAASNCTAQCPYALSSMTEGDIYTVAGDGQSGYSGDAGPATSAELGAVDGLFVDSSGDLFIADAGRLRVVTGATPPVPFADPPPPPPTTSGTAHAGGLEQPTNPTPNAVVPTTAPPGPALHPAPTPFGNPTVGRVSVRSNVATVAVSCPGPRTSPPCRATLRLAVVRHVSHGRITGYTAAGLRSPKLHTKSVIIGRKILRLHPGQTETTYVALNNRPRVGAALPPP